MRSGSAGSGASLNSFAKSFDLGRPNRDIKRTSRKSASHPRPSMMRPEAFLEGFCFLFGVGFRWLVDGKHPKKDKAKTTDEPRKVERSSIPFLSFPLPLEELFQRHCFGFAGRQILSEPAFVDRVSASVLHKLGGKQGVFTASSSYCSFTVEHSWFP